MTQEITLSTVLEHIQSMKYDLQTQIGHLGNRISKVENSIVGFKTDLSSLRSEMLQGFEEARQHRQALQEDLDATIRMQGKHETAITRLTKKSR